MHAAACQPRVESSNSRLACLAAAFGLLATGAAAHVWYLLADCPLDLAGDEAHYWEWSRRLDLSYYSKGPLVAYIIAAGRAVLGDWSRELVGTEVLAVRLPAMALSVLTALGIFTLTRDVTRSPRLALAAVALTFTMPILAAGSMLMTIDAPLMCAWTWALVCVERGLRHDRTASWVAAGLLIAMGVLAKYTMVLIFPAVGLAILVEPGLRAFVRRPGPYLATVIGLAGFAPILVWNARHDWVSFRHVAGQAGVADGGAFDLGGVLSYVAGQAVVVNAFWFVALLWAAAALWAQPLPIENERHNPAGLKLLLLAMILPWLVFLCFSPLTKVQPNWPVPALAAGAPVLAVWLNRRLRRPAPRGRVGAVVFVAAGVLLGGTAVVVMHQTEWLMPLFARLARNAPPWELTPVARYDPTARLRGWSELGAAVGEVLEDERAANRDAFILTDDYQVASEIAFYCPGNPEVYCVQSALGDRLSQYDIWPNPVREPERFIGRPCVYVGRLRAELTGEGNGGQAALPGMRRVRTVEHAVRGHPLRVWSVYVCDVFAGFPASGPAGPRKF